MGMIEFLCLLYFPVSIPMFLFYALNCIILRRYFKKLRRKAKTYLEEYQAWYDKLPKEEKAPEKEEEVSEEEKQLTEAQIQDEDEGLE